MLVALGILLLLRRLVDHVSFGIVLGACSAFYGINAYFSWLPSDHKIALFGFVFRDCGANLDNPEKITLRMRDRVQSIAESL